MLRHTKSPAKPPQVFLRSSVEPLSWISSTGRVHEFARGVSIVSQIKVASRLSIHGTGTMSSSASACTRMDHEFLRYGCQQGGVGFTMSQFCNVTFFACFFARRGIPMTLGTRSLSSSAAARSPPEVGSAT